MIRFQDVRDCGLTDGHSCATQYRAYHRFLAEYSEWDTEVLRLGSRCYPADTERFETRMFHEVFLAFRSPANKDLLLTFNSSMTSASLQSRPGGL
jgi:hypothetical protein